MSPLVVIPLRRGINEPVVAVHKVIIRTLPLGINLISVKKEETTMVALVVRDNQEKD